MLFLTHATFSRLKSGAEQRRFKVAEDSDEKS